MARVLRTLDRYIFKQVFAACAASVGFFTFAVMAGNAFRDLLGYILAGQLSLGSAVELILLLVPFAVTYALPMGMLCGILLVLGRLSAESEIVAMRAAGLSLRRISLPIHVLAALGVIGGLIVNFYSMPRARTVYHEEFGNMLRTAPLNLIVPKTFIRDFRGVVAYVGERHGAEIKDIWIWRLDPEQRVTQFVRAETGRITLDENQNLLVLTLNHTSVEKRNENDPENVTAAPQTATFETTTQSFPLEKLFGHHSFTRKPEWYSPSELHEEIARLSVPKKDPHEEKLREIERMRYELIIQDKYTTAFAVLAFALVAVPLGIKVSRRETSANLGVAVALALAYYFLTVVVKWFNNQPGLRPDLLLWLPCLFFLGIGIWLNARIERAR